MLASTLDPVASEWLILRSHRPNVLVTGSNDLIDAVLGALRPQLQPPICEWSPDGRLPAVYERATLLIRNVGTLSLPQQGSLLAWLEELEPRGIQVVSTSALELLRLVHDGAFLDDLYYRLNVVRMDAFILTGQPEVFRSTTM